MFAAEFRDRVVHHLFYNYTHKLFERTFIADCYSCIAGRGTHYGVERLKKHIRSCSQNWSMPCYVLKLDIKGYFMSINRVRLLARCRELLGRVRGHAGHVTLPAAVESATMPAVAGRRRPLSQCAAKMAVPHTVATRAAEGGV